MILQKKITTLLEKETFSIQQAELKGITLKSCGESL